MEFGVKKNFFDIAASDVAPGQKRKGPNDEELRVSLRAEWEAMSKAEQEAVTKDRMVQLKENRVVRCLGKHTEEETAFHDAQATLARVENEVNTVPC